MALTELYADKLREELTGSIDTQKLAEAWAALHPRDVGKSSAPGTPLGSPSLGLAGSLPHDGAAPVQQQATKALPPELSAFLARAATAIQGALKRVLPGAWTEGWALGQQSAKASARAAQDGTAALDGVDWGSWQPGDVEAAYQVAGPGLRDLLASQDANIKAITSSRLEELGNILADYIGSPEVHRPLTGPVPPMYSVDALAAKLKGVLDNPERARMVANTELARAASAAAEVTYREMGVGQVRVSTAGDDRVCPECEAAEARGAIDVGTITVPLHPLCRCALVAVQPALAGAS